MVERLSTPNRVLCDFHGTEYRVALGMASNRVSFGPATDPDLEEGLRAVLSRIIVQPRRLHLSTPGVRATVPMIRGVWGAALHDLDGGIWRTVFEGRGDGSVRTPGYILRPAPPDADIAPSIEWISFGMPSAADAVLFRAWDIASGMGLGPERKRFHIKEFVALGPDGTPSFGNDMSAGWSVDCAAGPLDAEEPSELCFDAPLRLIRNGRLVTDPTLGDIVLGGLRRLRALLPADAVSEFRVLWQPALALAERLEATPWQGSRLDLVRWSARQRAELEVRGVAGVMTLPLGAGSLLPLLAALQWTHLGKSTVVGLGQMVIRGVQTGVSW